MVEVATLIAEEVPAVVVMAVAEQVDMALHLTEQMVQLILAVVEEVLEMVALQVLVEKELLY